jgi:hypothetical protein
VIGSVSADPSLLSPPNHKMKRVAINYTTQDNCGPVSFFLTVNSNEPQNGTGDGDTDTDWEIVDEHHVNLRAERSGSGNGRVYTVTIHAIDVNGNESTRDVLVTVPHDHGNVTIAGISDITKEEINQGLTVLVTPNPSKERFVLTVKSADFSPVIIRISDVAGRTIESMKNVTSQSTLNFGEHYAPGVYVVEIVQGKQKKIIKVLKK